MQITFDTDLYLKAESFIKIAQCGYFGKCNGCSLWNIEQNIQNKNKINKLTQVLKVNYNFDFNSENSFFVSGHHRDRADFVLIDSQLHFYGVDKLPVPIKSCEMLSGTLNEMVEEINSLRFNIKKGSLRIRSGYHSEKGIWLDFSNLDIKDLLAQQRKLAKLLDLGYVIEIGQKGKRLNPSDFKLSEPNPDYWFSTLSAEKEVGLYSLVSSFTQPSRFSNQIMLSVIYQWLSVLEIDSVLEFGSGVGNFTVPLSELSNVVDCLENDQRNIIALSKNIDKLIGHKGLGESGKVNLIRPSEVREKYDLIFVNPPRSGVQGLFDQIHTKTQTRYIGYVSCYLESFINDTQKLIQKGFQLKDAFLLDQFPMTEHFEILSLWEIPIK